MGTIQEPFDPNKLNLYQCAAYNNLGKQLYEKYDNIYIKEDPDDKELYLSVLQNSNEGFKLYQTIVQKEQIHTELTF